MYQENIKENAQVSFFLINRKKYESWVKVKKCWEKRLMAERCRKTKRKKKE